MTIEAKDKAVERAAAVAGIDRIAVTPEMRRFNNAVEAADKAMAACNYRVDELSLAHLIEALILHEHMLYACEIMKAGVAAGVIKPCP